MTPRLLIGTAALIVPCLALGRQRGEPFHVERLGDGVYAVVRHDPIGYGNNANSLVVVGDSDVIVVDAQFTRLATLQTIGAIRRITNKPVRYVVNTHWHDDHAAGNQVYRDTFPAVDFVAQENTRRDLATIGAANRKGTVAGAGPFAARLDRLMSVGLGADSTPITPSERVALTNNVAIVKQYLAEAPGFRETLPTLTFGRSLTLNRGARRVELHWFGPANTEGDAVVYVPGARVVATGDLVVYPVPFAFNAFVTGWIGALDSLRALRPVAYVPGHGSVLHDDTYIVRVRTTLSRIRDAAIQGVARGDSIDVVRKNLDMTAEQAEFAGGDKWLKSLFTGFFVGPALARAYAEASRR